MAQSLAVDPMYFYGDADYNIIGNEGCRYISKANWPKLKNLYLGTRYDI